MGWKGDLLVNPLIRKATKKPVEIEAMQWQPGDSISAAIREWAEPAVAITVAPAALAI